MLMRAVFMTSSSISPLEPRKKARVRVMRNIMGMSEKKA